MTADAVRAAGGGSVDKGADKMYNLMKDLESRYNGSNRNTNLPAQFIEDLGKEDAAQLTFTTAIPVDTSKFAPQVAAQDALQTQAATLAQQGVGSFQPFITAAQQAAADAGATTGGIAGLTGAPTAAQTAAFTSPFQQQVIDTTLAEFDRQRAINEQNIRDQQAQLRCVRRR